MISTAVSYWRISLATVSYTHQMCIRDRFGSTKRGIAYAYGDKYMKKTLRMGYLLHLDDAVKKRLVTMVDSKNLVMEGSYNAAPISVDEMWACLLYTSSGDWGHPSAGRG